MKFHVFLYDGYVSFEIMLATYLLKTKGEIVTVGLSGQPVISYEGFKVTPDIRISELSVSDICLFVVPGGDIEEIRQDVELIALLNKLNHQNKKIATICSANDIIDNTDIILKEKILEVKSNQVRLYENVLQAEAYEYVDFAIELGSIMDIYSDKNDLKETIDFFKYFKN